MKQKNALKKPAQKDREDLAGEHTLGDLGQIILFLIFLSVWILDTFFVMYSTLLSNYIPILLRIPLSVVILLISGFIAKSGLGQVFGEVRDQPIVIQTGVFSMVRHPIYLSAILLYLSLLIFSSSIISFVIWIIIISFYYYISEYEEKLLLKKFGKEYEEYMKEVPMLIPRLFK